MNNFMIVLTIIIPTIEMINLFKGRNNLSIEAFALLNISTTLISTLYPIKIKEKYKNIMLGGWICFMMLFFAFGIGENLMKLISPITNTLTLFWNFIWIGLNNFFRKKE